MKKLFTILTLVAIVLLVLLTGINKTQMATSTGVYWQGADGNYYVKSGGAVNNFGPSGNFAPLSSSVIGGLQQISDPNPPTQTSVLGESATGSSGTSTATDPATIASLNQAISNTNQAVDRLPAQQTSGLGSIDASYQNALNQLLLGKNQANSAYDTSKTQTGSDYVQAKNTIGAQAGSTLSGLLRLLGARGAGGSSAYNVAAPQAVASAATGQRQSAGNTFGANNQALDTNWNNYLRDYNNQVSSADSQRTDQRKSLNDSIATNKASLLQSLAGLQAQLGIAQGGSGTAQAQPYLDQANGILNGLASYSTAPINYQTQAYNAPSLSSYTSSPTTPTYQGQAPQNDYFSPYLGALLGKKQPIGA